MRTLFLAMMVLFLLSTAQAQYYEVGKTYSFRSLSASDSSKAVVVEVVYDAEGRALLKRKMENATRKDTSEMFHLFGPIANQVVVASYEDTIEVRFRDRTQYWIIPWEGSGEIQALSTDKIVVVCNCRRGGDKCAVTAMVNQPYVTATCVRERCRRCEIGVVPVEDDGGESPVVRGGMLVLKARSVSWR